MKTKSSLSLLALAALTLAGTACSPKSPDAAPSAPAPSAPASPSAPSATPPAASSVAPPSSSSIAPNSSMAMSAMPGMTRSKAPAGAKVYFVGIKNGDTVTSPFKVGFGVDGMKLAPAGTMDAGTGHHHLIVDADLPPQTGPLPADAHNLHFGKAQTETELTLPAGPHTLQLELADGTHMPFDPPVVSDKISITVK